jgi:X-linked retinitis pigmentosa GTPase regulator
MASKSTRKLVLKKLSAYNTIWHPESTLVFKSQKERLVIGRLENDTLIELDDTCLELCEEWKFNPDTSLLEESEEQSEEEVEQPSEEQNEEESEEQNEEESEEQNEEPSEEQNEEPSEESSEEPSEEPSEEQNEEPSVRNLTNNFNKELFTIFDKMNKNNLSLTSKNKELEKQLTEKNKELEELKNKYDAMDQKFKTMKSLFS